MICIFFMRTLFIILCGCWILVYPSFTWMMGALHCHMCKFFFYFNAPDQTSYRHPSCTAPHSCRHCSLLDFSHLTVIGPTLHEQLCALAPECSPCLARQQAALKFYSLEKEERKKIHYSPEYLSSVLKWMLGNEQPCLHSTCKTFTDKRQSFCKKISI